MHIYTFNGKRVTNFYLNSSILISTKINDMIQRFYALAIIALIVLSCQKVEVDHSANLATREITAYGSISAFENSSYGVNQRRVIYWEDTQGLWGWESDVQTFNYFHSYTDNSSANSEFSGQIIGDKVRFIYPYYTPDYFSGEDLLISLASQSVDMERDDSKLTSYMYLISDELEVVDDKINYFEMQHITSILNCRVAFDGVLGSDSAQITQIELLGVPTKANLSWDSDIDECLSDLSKSENLIATIKNASLISDGDVFEALVSVFPGAISNLSVEVTYYIKGLKYVLTSSEVSISAMEFERGYCYDLEVNCSSESSIEKIYSLDGEGSAVSPYLISSKEDMATFANIINTNASSYMSTGASAQNQLYFELTQDIDLEGSADNQWTPVGDYNTFVGCFDGGGFTVSGLYIDGELRNRGLFGYVGEGGIVANLTVDGTISGDNVIGGVVGSNQGTIINCCNLVSISGDSNYSGGVAGVNYGIVVNCCNIGDILIGSGSNIGGLAGFSCSGTVLNSFNVGLVSGSSYVGGVVGFDDDGDVTNCYRLSGCVVQGSESEGGSEVSDADIKSDDFVNALNAEASMYNSVNEGVVQACGWKQGSDGYPALDFGSDAASQFYGFESGDGTYSSPYQISSQEELSKLRFMLEYGYDMEGKYFALTRDVDLEGSETNQWGAIGSYANPFVGHLDGRGYTVSGIYINNKLSCQALFACVGEGGVIENLLLEGTVIGGEIVGGIVGCNLGRVVSCSIQADVSGIGDMVGGVVGSNYGSVEDCSHLGLVNGGKYVGGVIGCSYNGIVERCFHKGSVSSSGNCVGGLVGYIDAGLGSTDISNCYSIGDVTGASDYAGGLVGGNGGGTIHHCYCVGSVSGGSYVGGVVGANSLIFYNCYWNSDLYSGDSFGGSSGGIYNLMGLSTADMHSSEFVSTMNASQDSIFWVYDSDGINEGYPILDCD